MEQTSTLESGEQRPTRMQKFFHFIRRHWVIFLITIIIIVVVFKIFVAPILARRNAEKQAQNGSPQPVTAVITKKADFDVYLKSLGTVIPMNTVTVKSQVAGQLMSVNFKEGQIVKKGDLLSEIDPRPFQVQLMQAEGQLEKDEEYLRNAESDLAIYKLLQ